MNPTLQPLKHEIYQSLALKSGTMTDSSLLHMLTQRKISVSFIFFHLSLSHNSTIQGVAIIGSAVTTSYTAIRIDRWMCIHVFRYWYSGPS